jgi:DNA-binding NarL/FixJ family response regulator
MILIVDDNINFVNRMVGLLEDMDNIGYISIASDYYEAYNVLLERRPDFVLLDINLPGKNGIELLRAIKQNNWNCEVIMITNHANEYYREQCLESGAKYFLDKTNEFALVPDIISRLVSAKQ